MNTIAEPMNCLNLIFKFSERYKVLPKLSNLKKKITQFIRKL